MSSEPVPGGVSRGDEPGSGEAGRRIRLADVVDLPAIQELLGASSEFTRIPARILDRDGSFLAGSDRREECSCWRRPSPGERGGIPRNFETEAPPAFGLPPGTSTVRRCAHRLWNLSTPLAVAGQQVGDFCVGPFRHEDASWSPGQAGPDAGGGGVAEEGDPAALEGVPLLEGAEIARALAHHARIARAIGALGERELRLSDELKEKESALESLGRSEVRRQVLDALSTGVVLQSGDGGIVTANPAAEQILGLTVEELIGRTSLDPRWRAIHEDGSPFSGETDPLMVRLLAGEPLKEVVMGVHRPDGSFRWLSIDVVPLPGQEAGSPSAVVTSFRDITARHAAEALLRIRLSLSDLASEGELEQLYQAAVDEAEAITSSRIGFFHLVDEDQENLLLQAWSSSTKWGLCEARAEEKHYPISRAGVWVDCFFARVPVVHNDYASLPGRKGLPEGHVAVTRELTVPVLRNNKVIAIMGVGNKPTDYVPADVQAVQEIASMAMDLVDRVRAEEGLRRSEERLRVAADAAGLGTFWHDLGTGRLSVDERCREHLGLAAADISLEEFVANIHPDDLHRLRESIARSLDPGSGDGRDHTEYRILRPDGEVRWISNFVRIHFEGEGAKRHPLFSVGTSLDVTQRRRADEGRLAAEKLEALGTLAAGIAHDFNNVLLAIRGNAALAARDLAPGIPGREFVAEIERAGMRAAGLVRQIAEFVRPGEQTRAAQLLGPVVDEALKLLRPTLPALVEIRTDETGDVPPVDVDSGRLHQVVVNLVTNAAHAIGSRPGRIDVTLSPFERGDGSSEVPPGLAPGRYVRLSVSDDGGGMDAATLARLFDPFFTTKAQGAGLGLPSVERIVKNHGGGIAVRSEPGRGTTFDLYFPAAAGRIEAAAAPRPVGRRGRTQHLLVVDDDDALVRLYQRFLGSFGYRVTGVADPVLALTRFREDRSAFDAVVTDASMPGMSGFDLAREVLALRGDVPVIVTSGYVTPAYEEEAKRLGVRRLISKPDTIDELVGTLDRIFLGAEE